MDGILDIVLVPPCLSLLLLLLCRATRITRKRDPEHAMITELLLLPDDAGPPPPCMERSTSTILTERANDRVDSTLLATDCMMGITSCLGLLLVPKESNEIDYD